MVANGDVQWVRVNEFHKDSMPGLVDGFRDGEVVFVQNLSNKRKRSQAGMLD